MLEIGSNDNLTGDSVFVLGLCLSYLSCFVLLQPEAFLPGETESSTYDGYSGEFGSGMSHIGQKGESGKNNDDVVHSELFGRFRHQQPRTF